MKQCEICLAKGLFLKLKNGLCDNCYNELKTLESTYEDIVDKMCSENTNTKELNSSLNKLIVKIRKFDSINNTIKEEDCLRLLDSLKPQASPTYALQEDPVTLPYNMLDTDNSKNTNVIFEVDYKADTYNSIINKENNNAIAKVEEHTVPITNKIPTLELANSQLYYNGVNENPEIIKIKAIEAVQKSTSTVQLQPASNVDNTKEKSTLVNEALNIISSIRQNSENIQELTYYTLLLKDKYLDNLLKNGITEIDNINVNDLINNTLNLISIKLNFHIEEIPNFFNYVTIGIQTSGQHLPNSEILEISANKISYGKVIDTFYSYVKPIKTLNIQTQRATGISNACLESAPSVEKTLTDLREFADGYMFIGYNINFISSFINYYYSLYFNKDLITKSECLLKLYRIRYKSYYSEPPKRFDLISICNDMLDVKEIIELNSASSKASSSAIASYKLFEILKYKYK